MCILGLLHVSNGVSTGSNCNYIYKYTVYNYNITYVLMNFTYVKNSIAIPDIIMKISAQH